MKNPALIGILGCAALAGFVGWRVHAMRTQKVNHFEVLFDPSLSYAAGCRSFVGSAEEVLGESSASPNSTLTVLSLGDDSTANEPRQLARYPIPTNRKVIEGRLANVRRQENVLKDIWSKCTSVQRTSVSPIFLGVKQAIADLRGHGCGQGSQCELRVNSDLEENVERAVKARINHTREAKESLPKPLDNAGIKVDFCGFAATAGYIKDPSGRELRRGVVRDPNREDRLQNVWRALFAKPEIVRFEPFCPQPAVSPAQEAAMAQGGQR